MTLEKFEKIYKKLLKNNNEESLISMMEKIIMDLEKHKNEKYKRNIKYTEKEYIYEIISVLSNNISWRKHIGKIDGRVLNNKHNHYVKLGVYDKLYLLNKRKHKKESKILSIDSTFVQNKNGKEKIGRNVFFKGIKVTSIVDKKGITIEMRIDKGNYHDARIAPKIINKIEINKNNKNKYLLGDKGYDSQKIRKIIKKKGITPIIAKRKNNKRVKKFNKKEKEILKKG